MNGASPSSTALSVQKVNKTRPVVELEEEMLAAAEDLRFEEAARIRDELKELRADLDAIRA